MPTSFGDFQKANKDLAKFDQKKTFKLKAKTSSGNVSGYQTESTQLSLVSRGGFLSSEISWYPNTNEFLREPTSRPTSSTADTHHSHVCHMANHNDSLDPPFHFFLQKNL